MDPITHGAVAYILYVLYAGTQRVISRPVSTHCLPARWALIPLAVGSQFPDLVDKPLAYWGVLVYGRSLAHSVFSLVIVGGLLAWAIHAAPMNRFSWLPTQLRAVMPAAFMIGYVGHLLGDAYSGVITSELLSARFLVYPLVELPPSPADQIAPWVRVIELYRDPGAAVHIELVTTAVLLFGGIRIVAYGRERAGS